MLILKNNYAFLPTSKYMMSPTIGSTATTINHITLCDTGIEEEGIFIIAHIIATTCMIPNIPLNGELNKFSNINRYDKE